MKILLCIALLGCHGSRLHKLQKDAQSRLCVVVRKVKAEEPAKPARKKR